MASATRLSADDQRLIAAAVQTAEANTSGEIVTIIADHSDRYLDVALWWSALAAIFALAALAAFPDFFVGGVAALSNGWIEELTTSEAFELALAVAVLKFGVVRLLLQWVPLRLLLTPGLVKSRRVRRRAVRYFKVGAERRTSGKTGILIYLSLSEHRAEIVADEAIHSKVDAALWGQAMADMIAPVREGRIADGMAAAIRDVGEILANHFPRDAADVNELPDRVIEI